MSKLHDKRCLKIVRKNINMTVPWYLMASYAYYVEDNEIISDDCFDKLSILLKKYYDKVEHMHKEHITKDMLTAGTYLGKYPSMVIGAVENLRGLKDEKE